MKSELSLLFPVTDPLWGAQQKLRRTQFEGRAEVLVDVGDGAC